MNQFCVRDMAGPRFEACLNIYHESSDRAAKEKVFVFGEGVVGRERNHCSERRVNHFEL